jgi:hypothetical protein
MKPTTVQANQRTLRSFFESNEGPCVLYFLHNILNEIQVAELQLQRNCTSVVDLHRIITRLIDKLKQRQVDKFYGQGTRQLLNQIKVTSEEKFDELTCSFESFIETVIYYIKGYYDDDSAFFEMASHFNIRSNEFLSWESVTMVVDVLRIENLNVDQLYSEYCELKVTFQQSQKKAMTLHDQVTKYISNSNSSRTSR